MKKGILLRLIAIMLVVFMAAGIVTGCSGNDKSDSATSPEASNKTNVKESDTPKVRDMKVTVLLGTADDKVLSRTHEDILTPIFREKTKVTVEYVTKAANQDANSYFQMLYMAGRLPDILSSEYMTPEIMEVLIEDDLIYEFKADYLKEHLPGINSRIEELGSTMEAVLAANTWSDGKNWGIPAFNGINPAAFPKLRDNEIYYEMEALAGSYALYFRDDILKTIFPNALTEKEVKDLYIANNGVVTAEQLWGDIPISTLNDLFDYLMKVKELNIKVGEKNVIPAALTDAPEADSIVWGLFTAMDCYWTNLPFKGEHAFFAQSEPWFKDYVSWWNKSYNAGLLDREWFTVKKPQIAEKAKNGEYAVMQEWLPVSAARKIGEERGYGYRLLPIWKTYNYNTDRQDAHYYGFSMTSAFGSTIITKKIKQEDLPQLMYDTDWHNSKEAADLKYWGLPEFYTGEGADRRFKPEYGDLEAWAAYNVDSEKGGHYYGLFINNYVTNRKLAYNPETMDRGEYIGYHVHMPRYVYPKKFDSGVEPDIEVRKTYSRDRYIEQAVFYEMDDWSYNDITSMPEWKNMSTRAYASEEVRLLLAAAIVAKPEDFNSAFAKYRNKLVDDEYKGWQAAVNTKWSNIYKTKVLPKISK